MYSIYKLQTTKIMTSLSYSYAEDGTFLFGQICSIWTHSFALNVTSLKVTRLVVTTPILNRNKAILYHGLF